MAAKPSPKALRQAGSQKIHETIPGIQRIAPKEITAGITPYGQLASYSGLAS